LSFAFHCTEKYLKNLAGACTETERQWILASCAKKNWETGQKAGSDFFKVTKIQARKENRSV